MANLKVLVTADINREEIEEIEGLDIEYAGYTLDYNVLDHKLLIEKCKDKEILVSEYDTVDAEVIENAKNLKLIVCCRGGVKSVVDLEAANKGGILVCNTPGRNANSVSDATVGLLIDITRNISKSNHLIFNKVITSDNNNKPEEYADTVWGLDAESPFIRFRGVQLKDRTLGLVGFGAVGRLVATKVKPFGIRVVVYDPYLKKEQLPEDIKLIPTVEDLVGMSDFVSLHCAVTDQTKGMFNSEMFSKMKNGSYFINTARGVLVDETALVAALNSGRLAGVAMDVACTEPIPNNSPLLEAKNLVLTPHISGSSLEVKDEGTHMVVASIKTFIKGETPTLCVNVL